ncbi:MAG: hypothetical protein QME41_08825, partial [Actinomycetota bacterium]|nr:hypothetical protein [Actinomycetota bacterium]
LQASYGQIVDTNGIARAKSGFPMPQKKQDLAQRLELIARFKAIVLERALSQRANAPTNNGSDGTSVSDCSSTADIGTDEIPANCSKAVVNNTAYATSINGGSATAVNRSRNQVIQMKIGQD